MAERLTNHNWSPKYPWDEWLDGSTWRIVRGEDFDPPTENFRINLYEKAKARGGSIRTQVVEDVIILQFLPDSKKEDD